MVEKLKNLLELKLSPQKVKNSLIRKTINPKIVDVQNTIFKDGKLVSINNDTNITVKLSHLSKYLKLGINISSSENANCQIFYKSENEDFCENNSIKLEINSPQKFFIVHDKNIDYLRIDSIDVDGVFDIEYFNILKISKNEYKISKKIKTVKNIKSQIDKNPDLINKFFLNLRNNGLSHTVSKIKSNLSKKEKVSVLKVDKINEYKRKKIAMEKDLVNYKEYKEYEEKEFDIKAIAFYLPQFHPIPENDENWGKGFTEWTNVTKALPNFDGHYQPQLPIDLGFYDLRIVENIKRQAELARNYGVYGFCFHHYWFDGKGIMRTPIDLLLENKDININFCINWANENWTKTWDGREKDVLLKQNHCDEDDLKFIQDSSKYFEDSRYIRVNNKPLLMIYRPSLFPNIKNTVKIWRKWYKENYDKDLYLVLTDSFEDLNPSQINFDASVNFVPNTLPLESIEYTLSMYNKDFKGGIVSYEHAIEAIKNQKQPSFKKFRGICPSWDNTPRRQDTGYIIHGSTPEKYKNWLRYISLDTLKKFEKEESFIFINAWNEWAEGAHLEPDRKFGYAYLDATREVLEEMNKSKIELVNEINQKFTKK